MYSVISRWTEDRKIDMVIINDRIEPTIHIYNQHTDEIDSFVDYQGKQYSLIFETLKKSEAEKCVALFSKFN